MKRILLLVVLLMACAAQGFAQNAPVLNPSEVEFTPSPDHALILADTTPAVTGYALELYQQGASAPFHTIDLGKPAPNTAGKIVFNFSSSFAAWPFPQTGANIYEARVTAIGPYGVGRSTPSNPFGRASAPGSPSDVTIRRSTGTIPS